MAEIHVCPGPELTAAQLYDLLVLRSAVFVVEQQCPYLDPDGHDLSPGTVHLWAASPDHPIAAALRVLDDADGVRIGRVVTHADHRGEGRAAELMQAALDVIGDRPSTLEAQSHLTAWYERFGYAVSGAEYVEDGIPHLSMSRPGV
ncbi:MAG: GNAT family N-acetyltransferase [Acidimicrobiales bacterium]|nr:GNAT family N-acetyltransferase [Acidimicrobiales bacterium]